MTPTELRALVAAMSPGKYEVDTDNGDGPEIVVVRGGLVRPIARAPHDGEQEESNLTALATLRNLAPALVDLWECAMAYRDATDAREAMKQDDDPMAFARAMAAESEAYRALLAAAKRVGE